MLGASQSARLRIFELEKAFVQVAIDLREILVLDGIDQLADPSSFRIRSHDLYGSLPEIVVKDTGDRYPVLDSIEREAAKLIAMGRIRNDLGAMFPGCEFLSPTKTDTESLVGLRFAGRTVLAEDRTHWEAYHELAREAVRTIL
jgi:hypothetical protein